MPKRELSEFFIRELLFDYLQGQLDEERTNSVKEGLELYPQLKAEIQSLKHAQGYATQLGKMKCNSDFLKTLKPRQSKFGFYFGNLRSRIPIPMSWTAQAGAVGLAIALGVAFAPRIIQKAEDTRELILAESAFERNKPQASAEPTSASTTPVAAAQVSIEPAAPTPEAVASSDVASAPKPTIALGARKPPTPTETPEPQEKGFVYRAYLTSSKVEALTPTFVAKIQALGGRKAGEVELGWKRRSGSYFHFAMPEAEYETLLAFLHDHGPVRIQKSPHRRVMPTGQIRIILWLEHDNLKKQPEGGHVTEEGDSVQ